jgi:hypothetical protein
VKDANSKHNQAILNNTGTNKWTNMKKV